MDCLDIVYCLMASDHHYDQPYYKPMNSSHYVLGLNILCILLKQPIPNFKDLYVGGGYYVLAPALACFLPLTHSLELRLRDLACLPGALWLLCAP